MSRYKAAVRHMNAARFLPFLLRMAHLHNVRAELAMQQKQTLVQSGASADLSVDPACEPKQNVFASPSPLFAAAQQVILGT
jgi:hypothetical protein